MNSKGGIGATMAVVAAVLVGVSYLPHGGGDKNGLGQDQKQNAAPAGVQTKISPNEACDAISKRLARFVKVKPPNGCQETVLVPSQSQTEGERENTDVPNGKLEAVIALVPHPLQTHLPLFFDRAVEAIQDAAQDEGYSYDSSWFPWDENKRQYLSLLDEEASHDLDSIREKQPGVLVFRKSVDKDANGSYQNGLAVFLVGEQPTGGINDIEFGNALDWVKALDSGNSQPLRILGPTTSGALPSLSRALHADSNLLSWKDRPRLIVYSGTVSASDSLLGFCQDMADIAKPVASGPPCHSQQEISPAAVLDFRTYQESDAVEIDRLCRYLKRQHYDLGRMAFVSEDETAYGAPDVPDACEPKGHSGSTPIHLYYPRDISALRAAYEQESIFSSAKQASSGAPSPTLRGDLTEPTSNKHDTVKTYGGELDAMAQESILLGIAEQLRSNQIQFVVLSSSNTLDQVFLSQFLRRSYPEGRVIVLGSDLLALRSAQSISLRGVMVLSTYPLISQQQRWTGTLKNKTTNSFHLFGEDSAESLYIAARELIERGSVVNARAGGEGNSAVPIYDYAPPRWAPVPPYFKVPNNEDPHRPATWLTVIGHQRFWPVSVLNDSTIAEKPQVQAPSSMLTPSTEEERCDDCNPQGEELQFPLQMKILLGAVTFVALWHLVCCWSGALNGPRRSFAYFAPVERPQQRVLIFLSSAAVGLGGIVLAVMAGMTRWAQLAPVPRLILLLFSAVALVASGLSVFRSWGRPRIRSALKPAGENAPANAAAESKPVLGLFPVLGMVVLLGAYGALLHFGLVAHLIEANRYPTFWRSVNLLSGVSPLLPQVLFLAGLYGWCWFNLKGLALLGSDRPYLPTESSMDAVLRLFSRESRQRPTEKVELPAGREWAWRFGVCLVVIVLALWISLRHLALASLGELTFGRIIFGWLALLSALVLADAWLVLDTWRALHGLLGYLDRLRMRRTFAALRGLCWGSLWKMSGNPLEERYRVLSRQFESLLNLENSLKSEKQQLGDGPDASELQPALAAVSNCMATGMEFATWYVLLEKPKKAKPLSGGGNSLTASPVLDIGPMVRFQKRLAYTAGRVMTLILLQWWQTESDSLIFDKSPVQTGKSDKKDNKKDGEEPFSPSMQVPDHVRAAEEFVAVTYLGFIQNTLGRIRTIVFGTLVVFVAMTLAIASYPFEPLPVLGGFFLALFVGAGAILVIVYSAMNRDAILSYVTNTNPGELGWSFWGQLITFAVTPLFALLTTLFPSFADFLLSWVQPSAGVLK